MNRVCRCGPATSTGSRSCRCRSESTRRRPPGDCSRTAGGPRAGRNSRRLPPHSQVIPGGVRGDGEAVGALRGSEAAAVDLEFVLLRFAAEYRVVVQDQAARRFGHRGGELVCGAETGEARAHDNRIENLPRVDPVGLHGVEAPMADAMRLEHRARRIAVRRRVVTHTAKAVPIVRRRPGWRNGAAGALNPVCRRTRRKQRCARADERPIDEVAAANRPQICRTPAALWCAVRRDRRCRIRTARCCP